MSKKYDISISSFAYNDIASITDYFVYEIKDRDAGLTIADHIFDSISSLENMPFRHKCFYKEIRAFPVISYLVFYIVENNIISVVRVLHQRQKWDRILKNYY